MADADPTERRPAGAGSLDPGAGRGGRRALVHAQTHDAILDAAADLVTERGIDGLNLNDVAAKAGFGNAASLYRYFASKQEIVSALAARGLERLGEHMRSVPEDLPPDEQIVEMCLTYLDCARAHPVERRLLLTTAASIASDYRATQLSDEFVDRMLRLGRAARDAGALTARDDGDIFVILHAAWALAHGMAGYDGVYDDPERELLRSRHRAVFRAYVAAFRSDWTG